VESLKAYLARHSEQVFALTILVSAPLINYIIPYKLVFLNFYFILILLGTYYLETRTALMGGILCTMLMTVYVYYFPSNFSEELSALDLWMSLMAWSGFLILAAALVGKLISNLKARNRQLEESERELNRYAHRLENITTGLVHLGTEEDDTF